MTERDKMPQLFSVWIITVNMSVKHELKLILSFTQILQAQMACYKPGDPSEEHSGSNDVIFTRKL